MAFTSSFSFIEQQITAIRVPNWECYHCGFCNYDNSLYCTACCEKCMYVEDSSSESSNIKFPDSEPSFSESSSSYDSNSNSNNDDKKQQYTTLDIISLMASDSIQYTSKRKILVYNLPEYMVNEDLGSKQLFGMFGDVKKIEIIRKNESLFTTQKNPNAEITFYKSDSIVELRKLSSAYYNHKIFNV